MDKENLQLEEKVAFEIRERWSKEKHETPEQVMDTILETSFVFDSASSKQQLIDKLIERVLRWPGAKGQVTEEEIRNLLEEKLRKGEYQVSSQTFYRIQKGT